MHELLIIAGIHLLAVMSPGPDFVMMLRNSLMYSRSTAIWSAIGLGGGIALHVTYCLLGIGLLISKSIVLFSVIKWLGAAYLIYIGVKSLQARKVSKVEVLEIENQGEISKFQALKLGFLTNALNPKATLFFLALFTQVINPSTAVIWKVAYGVEMVIATILWFSLVAVFMTQNPVRKAFMGIKHHVERVFGLVLIALGVKVALSTR